MLAGREVKAKSKQVSELRKRPEERSRRAQHQSQVEAVIEETPMAAIQNFDSEDVIRHRDMGCKHLRKTGIDFLGDSPWGTHFCQFYQTKEDLMDILVPYFKAGLENNEFCMWITSEPLSAEDAKRALKKKVKDLDDYIKKGQIEILDFSQWYTISGRFDSNQVLRGWVEKEQKALEKGFDGLRLTGNTFWLEKEDWENFKNYEAVANSLIGKHRMLAICAYCLDKCTASGIIDVVSNHQFAVIKQEGTWEIIESAEHKEAKEVLRVERDKLNDILDSIQDGVYIVNQENDIQYINPVLQKEFGPVNGNKCYEYFHDRKEVCPWCKNQEVFAGKTVRWEWYSFKNQKAYDLIDTPLRNSDGSISKLAIFRDITERKLAEEALRESEKKYHQLVETMNEGLSVSDENYIFTFVNRRFAEILGYPPDKIVGRHITDFFDTKNKKIMRAQMARRRRGEEKSYDITWTGKDNRKIDTIISPRAFFDKNGNYKGSLGIFTNITERKRFERQILKLNKGLEKIVAKRTAKLRKAHKLLLEDIKKRKSLEKEILNISEREKRLIGQELHDSVGQHFTGIAFMARALQQRIADKLPHEAADAAQISELVNEAIEQIRKLAKGLHPVDLNAGSLTSAIHELTATTERLFGIRCNFKCERPIPIKDTDVAVHLYRITQEVITNAIKHGRAKNIRIRLDYDSDDSVLTVKSDGLDFPKEFEARGTGMGLQIMDHRADIIGGSLNIRKAAEGGTIVTCVFPNNKH